ncbi:MAG: DNA methyltransferase [Bacteroidota bacterium]|nr:DNA methyltransferase [Bacteroidota bacterium]
MTNNILKPRKALNKTFLKEKVERVEIELFKRNLIQLIERIDEKESEEFHKNLIIDFLKDTYYKNNYFINTKERTDLVIHNGKKSESEVAVLIETKKPTNKNEMLQKGNINRKALHELLLYYLRERITNNNLEIKFLIATNIYEWFIFDVYLFEKYFVQNKELVEQFKDFEDKRLSGKTTDFFYEQIAKPFIKTVDEHLEYTFFDIRDYEETLKIQNRKDDNKLIALFKLLSSKHLLKLPFANDSNSLNRKFYTELLHIVGLEEIKKGSKKLIQRNKASERNSASIIENTIRQLEKRDIISGIEKPSNYGKTQEERLFTVALELTITWINRILFLKLLESQLVSYHKGDTNQIFLNIKKIENFDDLDDLFFAILAKKTEERTKEEIERYGNIPFLNSSLFEPTELERETIYISNLEDERPLPIYSKTVLLDKNIRRKGTFGTLEYLFEFLNAYDFSSEGKEDIQEDKRSLINASVLGLIFEKINGYQDGSFFTPGFITMYMCSETIRKAVVQKFSETERYKNVKSFENLTEEIDTSKEGRKLANEIINSIHICDPAVGSGHFLVSALNEIISIKSELGILNYCDGSRIKNYKIEIDNDELTVFDEEEDCIFDYSVSYNPESGKRYVPQEKQNLQEAIFYEKQNIIENCLFGVDININSVKICRLRLWIELLKNSFYKKESNYQELETLPNIDINIKCGNSLISRFELDSNLKKALRKSKWNIESYRLAVDSYKRSKDKSEKREMRRLIDDIKSNFQTVIGLNDPKKKRLDKLANELYSRFTGNFLFEPEEEYGKQRGLKKKRKNEQSKLENEIEKLSNEIDEIKNNKIYKNAFEWRFEFPEVLNNEGDFIGFDVVIGNPPYVGIKALEKNIVDLFFESFKTSTNRINLYSLFIERSFSILKDYGEFAFIIPNSILVNLSYQKIRNYIFDNVNRIVKLPDNVFVDASVETIILGFTKGVKYDSTKIIKFWHKDIIEEISNNSEYIVQKSAWELFNDKKFNIYFTKSIQKVISKIYKNSKELEKYADFTLGITPYDKYKGHSQKLIKNREYHSHTKKSKYYKPLIKGENIIPYYVNNQVKEYILYGEWLGASRKEKFFTDSRVIVRQIVSGNPPKIYAGYSKESLYFTQIGFAIIPKNGLTPLELTALLNSKLINFYHKYSFLDIEKELFQKILIDNCKKFPIKQFEDKTGIENLVNQIIKQKQKNESADTTEIESKIDEMVYNIYGLNDEEINIVENS